eukprot:13955150-Alexandrium_andersonii.AAC.1
MCIRDSARLDHSLSWSCGLHRGPGPVLAGCHEAPRGKTRIASTKLRSGSPWPCPGLRPPGAK